MKMEKQYKKILAKALNGHYRQDRTKVGSYSIFNAKLSFSIKKYFPIISGRKIYLKIFQTEFLWFINGETNIKRFKDAGVKIWDNWADKNGNLGPIYGHQMRNFNSQQIDQLQGVINSLKTNKDSRRHIISLWNPAQINTMKLPPCYLYFQFFETNGHLNMFVVQRSGDLFLGIPYDVCLFSLLLLYVSEQVNLKPNKIDVQIVDAHIYNNQIEQVKQYLKINNNTKTKYKYSNKNLKLINYQYQSKLTTQVSV
jgi:thymidylate synthase